MLPRTEVRLQSTGCAADELTLLVREVFMEKHQQRLHVVGCMALLAVAALPAQTAAPAGEWRSYGADAANTHYSPLAQINASNFNKLEVAWRFKTDNLGSRKDYNLEATPLMANGVVYTTAGTRRSVVAIDAGTGELLWMSSEQEGKRGDVALRLTSRGLAYWTDGREERIVYVTAGYRMIALNAKTGMRIASFGKDGVVDLKENDDQLIDPLSPEIGLNATPAIGGDVIVVGAAHRAGTAPPSKANVKGYVRGFDVRTGKQLWIFHTVPKPGEFGYDTWEKDSGDYTGNTGVWGQISIDEQLGMAFLPVEMPTGDYYGGHRPGNGLFGETVVAVDLKTGVRKWHYQLVHHGIWDLDIPCAPILVDININGRLVQALAQPSKQAFLYVFDRLTGAPIWPIEERKVEQSNVPGEKTSLTQPFPTKPAAYDGQGSSIDDFIDFTPELRAEAVKLGSKYKMGPIFTPPVVRQEGGVYGTLTMATNSGGTNWAGGSYDPETHILYAPSQRILRTLGLIPGPPSKTDEAYIYDSAATGSGAEGAGPGLTVEGLPLAKPPYGSITAIDLNKGDILWRIAHGETPDYIKNHPALKGVNVPRTGRPGVFGAIVTKTLLISGERAVTGYPDASKLRAYDKGTGQEVGAVPMPAGQTGTPMTYMWKGKQYIVVAASGIGFPAELIAYTLPNSAE
jgi:quinoprotein glucose dehydrogenase